MKEDEKTIEILFLKCANWNTETCPHRDSIPMRLALINPAPRVMLSRKTHRQLYRLCIDCPLKKLS